MEAVQYITLMFFTDRKGEEQVSFEIGSRDGVEEGEESGGGGASKRDVVNTFFDRIESIRTWRLRIYGAQSDTLLADRLGSGKKYDVWVLEVDATTSETIASMFLMKCPWLNRVRRLLTDERKRKTNWVDLPLDIQRGCVDLLDFESRMRLRRVSTHEKQLVESMKYKLHSIHVYEKGEKLHAETAETYAKRKQMHRRFKQKMRDGATWNGLTEALLLHVFRFSNFSVLQLGDFPASCSDLIDKLVNTGPFRPESVYMSLKNDRDVDLFLKNLQPGCDVFTFYDGSEGLMTRLYSDTHISQLLSIRRLECCASLRVPWNTIATMWIENDTDIRHKVLMRRGYNVEMLEQFATNFASRIMYRNEDEVRISTDNPEKHILLRIVGKCIFCETIDSKLVREVYNSAAYTWCDQ